MADIVAERFIARTTLSATTSTITFTGIPGSYTDLVIISNGTFNTGDNGYTLQFNGDTGTNYSTTYVYGNGTSAASTRTTSATSINAGRMDTTAGVGVTNIMNYSNSTTYKTVITRGGSGTLTTANAGLWRSTAAVTSLTVACPAGISNFVSGTTFTLYGIV